MVSAIPLSQSPPGPFRVMRVLLPAEQSVRLLDLGLRPGATVSVVHNRGTDGLVVGINDGRVAIDHEIAQRVLGVAVIAGGES